MGLICRGAGHSSPIPIATKRSLGLSDREAGDVPAVAWMRCDAVAEGKTLPFNDKRL